MKFSTRWRIYSFYSTLTALLTLVFCTFIVGSVIVNNNRITHLIAIYCTAYVVFRNGFKFIDWVKEEGYKKVTSSEIKV